MTPIRTLLIGAIALTGAAVADPGDAAAGHRDAQRIAERLDRIERQVEDLRGIRRPFVRQGEIDRLQHVLARIERRNDDERGRLARSNDRRIDRLQRRLVRLERRGGHGHGSHRGGYRGPWRW